MRVNRVTPGLFAKYPTIADMASVRQEVLERDIQSTGFFGIKPKSLIGSAQKVSSEFGGKVPETMGENPHPARGGPQDGQCCVGNVVRESHGRSGRHSRQRITRRLDLTKEKDPAKIEKDLMETIPKKRWILFSHQIIHHGRQVCQARKPRCGECSLAGLCYAPDKSV